MWPFRHSTVRVLEPFGFWGCRAVSLPRGLLWAKREPPRQAGHALRLSLHRLSCSRELKGGRDVVAASTPSAQTSNPGVARSSRAGRTISTHAMMAPIALVRWEGAAMTDNIYTPERRGISACSAMSRPGAKDMATTVF